MVDESEPTADQVFERKRQWHREQARRPIEDKLRDLIAAQERDLALSKHDRGWWERPWPVTAEPGTTEHLRTYLASRRHIIEARDSKPLIVRWIDSGSPRMQVPLEIFDRKVLRLRDQAGGQRKLDDWFLSGDKNFAALTAERFVLDYVAAKNPGLQLQLVVGGGGGPRRRPDATLDVNGTTVGVEVTSLNGAIGSWILDERLAEALDDSGFLAGKRVRFRYSYDRVALEAAKPEMQRYVREVATAIESADEDRQRALGVHARVEPGPGSMWFDVEDARADWFRLLTRDLESKLEHKREQLSAYPRNLVFIAVNNLPTIWPFPQIFEALRTGDAAYERPIARLEQFWREVLSAHPNLDGICYYTYSIDREGPFYPLRIFWREDRPPIPLSL